MNTNTAIAAAALVIASVSSSLAGDAEILVQRYTTKIEEKQSFFDKTVKEATSKEGIALIGAAASIFGVSPAVVGLALGSVSQGRQAGQQHWQNIPSPEGYTICYAKPTGAIYNGVETTENSTFNAVIRRDSNIDGLAMYLAVPIKAGRTVRAMATYDVAFVRKQSGWQSNPKCRPTNEAAWLSKNNNTRLNIPAGQY